MKESLRQRSIVETARDVASASAIALGALATFGVNGPQLVAYQREEMAMPQPGEAPDGRFRMPKTPRPQGPKV